MQPRAMRSCGNSLCVSDDLLCVSLTMKINGYPDDLSRHNLHFISISGAFYANAIGMEYPKVVPPSYEDKPA